MAIIVFNGEYIEAKEARISVDDRGFRYGDGIFDTLRVDNGHIYQLEWHIRRLAAGLAALRIAYDVKNLPAYCQGLLQRNNVKDGLLRIHITRGVGGRGYIPDAQAMPTLVIETMPMPPIDTKPVALWVSDYEKISPRALPVQYKLSQGNSTLARMEATDNGCADALLLNDKSHVCETSSGNIFWVKDGELFTPALSCGVLDGSIRAAILSLSKRPVHEVATGLDALKNADAVFITNTVWRVLAVNEIRPVNDGWNSAAIAQEYLELIQADMA